MPNLSRLLALVVSPLLVVMACDHPAAEAPAPAAQMGQAAALLQRAERDGSLRAQVTPLSLMAGRLAGVRVLETADVTLSGAAPAPLTIVADDHRGPLSTATYQAPAGTGTQPTLRFEDGTVVAVPASRSAEDLVSLIYDHLGRRPLDRLRITIFRDPAADISAMDTTEPGGGCAQPLTADECDETSGDCCVCWKWAFCRNSPHCGPSCNAFTGKCNKAQPATPTTR